MEDKGWGCRDGDRGIVCEDQGDDGGEEGSEEVWDACRMGYDRGLR